MIEITAELIAACLGLLTLLLSILFAKVRDGKKLSDEQGDGLLKIARKTFEMAEIAVAGKPEYEQKLAYAEFLLYLVDSAWNDAKVRTPEFDELVDALMKVLKELN